MTSAQVETAPFDAITMHNGFFYALGRHCCLVVLLAVMTAGPVSAATWGPYRGMTTQIGISEQDVADFAKLGGNLLRVGFSRQPLMHKQPPYDFDEDAFSKLDKLLDWCKHYGIKVVIDPHTTPGTERNTTILATDQIWKDKQYHDLLNRLWDRIASRYSGHAEAIAGYDLLNEPTLSSLSSQAGASDYNALVHRLIATIRSHDQKTTIIIEPPMASGGLQQQVSRFEGLLYLDPPPDKNVVYSPHMYQPGQFTHQGVVEKLKTGVQYPGRIGVKMWDKDALRRAMEPALEMQRRFNVLIYIGEFSAARSTGNGGIAYLRDLIDLFEEYGWSWTYHAWREAPVWDAEIAGPDENDRLRTSDAPRLQLLREAFRRNPAGH